MRLTPQMLGQMSMYAEGNLAIGALKGTRIGCGGHTECRCHHHLILVRLTPLVLLQMSVCAERDATWFTLELALHVVDVHVQRQLMLSLEGLLANGAGGSRIVGQWRRRWWCHAWCAGVGGTGGG